MPYGLAAQPPPGKPRKPDRKKDPLRSKRPKNEAELGTDKAGHP